MLCEECGETSASTDEHANTQRPASSQIVERRPQKQIGWKFDGSRQEEVEEFVASKHWGVVWKTHVYTGVGEPTKMECETGNTNRGRTLGRNET